MVKRKEEKRKEGRKGEGGGGKEGEIAFLSPIDFEIKSKSSQVYRYPSPSRR